MPPSKLLVELSLDIVAEAREFANELPLVVSLIFEITVSAAAVVSWPIKESFGLIPLILPMVLKIEKGDDAITWDFKFPSIGALPVIACKALLFFGALVNAEKKPSIGFFNLTGPISGIDVRSDISLNEVKDSILATTVFAFLATTLLNIDWLEIPKLEIVSET